MWKVYRWDGGFKILVIGLWTCQQDLWVGTKPIYA